MIGAERASRHSTALRRSQVAPAHNDSRGATRPRCVASNNAHNEVEFREGALPRRQRDARRSSRGRDGARGDRTDRAACARRRAPGHNRNWISLSKGASRAPRPRNVGPGGRLRHNTNLLRTATAPFYRTPTPRATAARPPGSSPKVVSQLSRDGARTRDTPTRPRRAEAIPGRRRPRPIYLAI